MNCSCKDSVQNWINIWSSRAGRDPGTGHGVLFFSMELSGICDRLDDNYVIYTDFSEEGHFWLHLYCVRPRKICASGLDCGTATIFFSATLLPSIIIRICSLEIWRIYAVYAKSPFDPANRLLLVGTDVSSRYSSE